MLDRPEDAGTGTLFKNDEKTKLTHPDYRGDALIRDNLGVDLDQDVGEDGQEVYERAVP